MISKQSCFVDVVLSGLYIVHNKRNNENTLNDFIHPEELIVGSCIAIVVQLCWSCSIHAEKIFRKERIWKQRKPDKKNRNDDYLNLT